MPTREPKTTPTAVNASAPSQFDQVAALDDDHATVASHLMQRAISNTDQFLGRAIVRRAVDRRRFCRRSLHRKCRRSERRWSSR
jgi:hypothetical protein